MKRGFVYILVAVIVTLVLGYIGIIWFYPRSSQSFEKVKSISIEYYDDEYKTIEVTGEDKTKIFDFINSSKITTLDLWFVGDDCGGDGPSIKVRYNDNTEDFWDFRMDAQYCRYVYKNGIATKKVIIQNDNLKEIVQNIIDKN